MSGGPERDGTYERAWVRIGNVASHIAADLGMQGESSVVVSDVYSQGERYEDAVVRIGGDAVVNLSYSPAREDEPNGDETGYWDRGSDGSDWDGPYTEDEIIERLEQQGTRLANRGDG